MLLLLAAVGIGLGQEQNCPAQHLIVNVTGADDALIPGLQPNNFRVMLHGHQLNVVSAQIENRPIRVVILLDTSGSMGDTVEKFDLARRFAGEMIRSLEPENQVALLTFADQVSIVASLTRDRRPPAEGLIGLDPKNSVPPFKGHTAFFDALVTASSVLSPSQPGDAIYVITDGGDNHSRAHFEQVKQKLIEEGIRVFCAILEEYSPRTPEEIEGPERVWDLVRDTGGFGVLAQGRTISVLGTEDYGFKEVPKQQRAEWNMAHIYTRMQQFYLLETTGAKPAKKPENLKISVLDQQGHSRKHLILTYPTEILPCNQ